ncbi:hypothetical protein HRI_003778600 [Hibiscus trionum]|uniref:CCHC-type domain-containing protein n=1 Tax=Hibiscus trionum TaxID=183268 RepID=A0A9W7IW85_HIBTR|nr:hypothetical protein HRI_003778600 [Hibiscus trionum]
MAESSSTSYSKPFTNKTISIRLDDTNYLLWRQQVLFAIESLALVYHIDGTLTIPPQNVCSEKGNIVLNEEYVAYKQQDFAFCSWLLSSIGPSILPSLVSCKTALEIWEKVQQLFYVSLTTRTVHVHCSLRNLRKRDQSMKEYLAQVQSICDSLAACGNPLIDTMHISAILSGLSPEYEPVVITSSQQPYKLDGVCSILLDTEARQQEFLNQSFLVNMAQRPTLAQGPILFWPNLYHTQYGSFGQFPLSFQKTQDVSHGRMFQDQGRGFQGQRPVLDQRPQGSVPSYTRGASVSFQGRGRGFAGRSRVQCQKCEKYGHLANRCYF